MLKHSVKQLSNMQPLQRRKKGCEQYRCYSGIRGKSKQDIGSVAASLKSFRASGGHEELANVVSLNYYLKTLLKAQFPLILEKKGVPSSLCTGTRIYVRYTNRGTDLD